MEYLLDWGNPECLGSRIPFPLRWLRRRYRCRVMSNGALEVRRADNPGLGQTWRGQMEPRRNMEFLREILRRAAMTCHRPIHTSSLPMDNPSRPAEQHLNKSAAHGRQRPHAAVPPVAHNLPAPMKLGNGMSWNWGLEWRHDILTVPVLYPVVTPCLDLPSISNPAIPKPWARTHFCFSSLG